jgi:hypothetical protein
MRIALALALVGCASSPRSTRALHNEAHVEPMPDALAPRALVGPYRSTDDWCADLARRAPPGCRREAAFVTRGPTRARGVALVPMRRSTDDGDPDVDTCALLLTAGDRVWIDEGAMPCLPADRYLEVTVDTLAWRDLIDAAQGPELVLQVTTSRDTASLGVRMVETSMIVCGTGVSGAPSCTPWIPIETYGGPVHVEYHPAIARDGTLRFDVDDQSDTTDPDWIATLARPHTVRFR